MKMLLYLSNVTSNQFPIDNYELDEEHIETFASLFWFSDFSLEKVISKSSTEVQKIFLEHLKLCSDLPRLKSKCRFQNDLKHFSSDFSKPNII